MSLCQRGAQCIERAPAVISTTVRSGGLLVAVYLLYKFLTAVSSDIALQYEQESARQEAQVVRCREEYAVNMCEPWQRRPALEEFCQEKEFCMNARANGAVKMLHIIASFIAQVFNSFFGQMELKTLVVVCLLLLLTLKCTALNQLLMVAHARSDTSLQRQEILSERA